MAKDRGWISWSVAAAAFAVSIVAATAAEAEAQTPSISGNGWVALGIIVVLVGIIALMIGGTLSVSRRGDTSDDDGGTGLPFYDDDPDDKPKRRR